MQTRTCINNGTCKGIYGKPNETQACVSQVEEPSLPAQLFDISIELEDPVVEDINKLVLRIVFESFGIEPTPVNLTFTILDNLGNEIYREEDYIVVETEKVVTKTFESLVLPEGRYILVLTTLYNVDVVDEFRQKFEIREEKPEESRTLIVLTALLLVAVIAAYSIHLKIRNRRKRYHYKKRKRHKIKKGIK